MSEEVFDDQPQWYWAVERSSEERSPAQAGFRIILACGQRELWRRVRSELSNDERPHWHSVGSEDGGVTLANCFEVLLIARESYGADYNRLVVELAQIPAFADFLYTAKNNLCNFISNPMDTSPLKREPYSPEALTKLAGTVEATLGVESSDWWE